MKSFTSEELEALKNAAKGRFTGARDAALKSLHKKAESLRALADSASRALETEIEKRSAASAAGTKTASKAPPSSKTPPSLVRKKSATGAAAKSATAKADPAGQVSSRQPQQKNLRGAVKSQLAHSASRGRRNQARRDAKN